MAIPIRRNREGNAEVTHTDPLGDFERLNRQLTGYLDSWRQLPSLLGDGFTPLADVEETDDSCRSGNHLCSDFPS